MTIDVGVLAGHGEEGRAETAKTEHGEKAENEWSETEMFEMWLCNAHWMAAATPPPAMVAGALHRFPLAACRRLPACRRRRPEHVVLSGCMPSSRRPDSPRIRWAPQRHVSAHLASPYLC